MPGKISEYTELTSGNLHNDDLVEVIDVSDTTMAASGTNKKTLWSSIKATLKTYFDTLYATASQGSLADTSIQPDDLGGAAALNVGTTVGTVAAGNDARFSDARTPTSHTHGGISNAGAIGSTSGLPIKTGTSGVLEAGAFGTSAGQFAEGNHTHDYASSTQGALADSAIQPTIYDANTIIIATADNTPIALPVAEQTLLGRITGGAIDDLSISQLRTMLGFYYSGGSFVGMPWERCIALSNETDDITASTSVCKVSFYAPFALTLTGLLGTLSVAGTGSTVIMDIHVAGTTVMSTNKISIDAGELTSDTAATAPGITTTAVAALALVELFIDQKGATIAGKGAKIQIYATRA